MIDPKELDELIHLLPFYVNGTLDGADRIRVDAALPRSAELRDALLQEYAVKDRIVAGLNAVVHQSPEHETARAAMLNARASAAGAPAASATVAAKPSGMLSALSFLNPRQWHPAITLSLALAIPAQAAVIASQSSHIAWLKDENFRLASGPCDDVVGGGHLLIEMKDGVRLDAVIDLLSREELEITAASDLGTLTVKTTKTGADMTAQLQRLRASAIVATADPAA